MIDVVVLAALSVYGLHTVVDNLLHTFTGFDLNAWWYRLNEPNWLKPIIFCPICMASVWGTIFYIAWGAVYMIDPVTHVMAWLPSLFAIAGINYVITRI